METNKKQDARFRARMQEEAKERRQAGSKGRGVAAWRGEAQIADSGGNFQVIYWTTNLVQWSSIFLFTNIYISIPFTLHNLLIPHPD